MKDERLYYLTFLADDCNDPKWSLVVSELKKRAKLNGFMGVQYGDGDYMTFVFKEKLLGFDEDLIKEIEDED